MDNTVLISLTTKLLKFRDLLLVAKFLLNYFCKQEFLDCCLIWPEGARAGELVSQLTLGLFMWSDKEQVLDFFFHTLSPDLLGAAGFHKTGTFLSCSPHCHWDTGHWQPRQSINSEGCWFQTNTPKCTSFHCKDSLWGSEGKPQSCSFTTVSHFHQYLMKPKRGSRW